LFSFEKSSTHCRPLEAQPDATMLRCQEVAVVLECARFQAIIDLLLTMLVVSAT